MDFFPESMRKEFAPVGRLDKDTEGFLLITNDGELTHRLLSPAYHVKKTYFVQVDQKIPDTTAGQFAEGVDIGDEKRTLPADLKILGDREAELTISEVMFTPANDKELAGFALLQNEQYNFTFGKTKIGGRTAIVLTRAEKNNVSIEKLVDQINESNQYIRHLV